MKVKCGTAEACDFCPLKDLDPEEAQQLGKVASCFVGTIPRNINITNAVELAGLTDEGSAVSSVTLSKIRKTATVMEIDFCVVDIVYSESSKDK